MEFEIYRVRRTLRRHSPGSGKFWVDWEVAESKESAAIALLWWVERSFCPEGKNLLLIGWQTGIDSIVQLLSFAISY